MRWHFAARAIARLLLFIQFASASSNLHTSSHLGSFFPGSLVANSQSAGSNYCHWLHQLGFLFLNNQRIVTRLCGPTRAAWLGMSLSSYEPRLRLGSVIESHFNAGQSCSLIGSDKSRNSKSSLAVNLQDKR